MADINQQTEELARIMEQVNREMAAYGQITKATADQKRDAEIEAATGLKNFTKASDKAADGVGMLGDAAISAGKSMLEGKKGAAVFNDSIDGMAKAAQAAGIALTLLVPGGVIIKGIIAGFTAVTAATAGMVKASNEMADKIYKGYSGLAKSGAAASDGMTGVFNDAKKLGLSMNELDQFVGLVGENSKDLALFSSSVFEGRKKFADMGKAMEPYRESLIKSGFTQEQINEGAMSYIRLQTRVGQSQNKTTAELADGAKKYLSEQDALTKLTGATRKENEAAMEEARSQQRFRAKLDSMRASGDEGQVAAAAELEKTYVLLRSQSKEAAQGFGDLTTGMMGTEAAQKTMMSTNGEAMQVANKMVAGQMKAIEGTQQIAQSAGKVTKDFNMMYQMGVGEDFLLSIKEGADLGLLAQKDLNKSYEQIVADQKKQGQEGGKAADGITDQYAKNIVQQQKLNEKMERTVFDGIDNALAITNKLGNVTDVLATGFEKLGKAVNKLLKIVGLGVEDTPEEKAKLETDKKQDQKNFESASFTEKIQSSLARGIEHAARGAGNLVGSKSLVGLADAAQQERVASESAYLKEKGKFQQVQPAGGQRALPAGVAPSAAGGGRGSAVPSAPGAAPAAGTAPGGAPTKAPPVRLTPQPQEGEAGKESTVKPEDVLSFTARSGSQQAFEGLDSNFKKAVLAAAEQYKAATGKPIQINSAKRDPADQERLYEETVKLGTPGKGPTGMAVAKPGRSLHERGHAVDIQQYTDSAAIAAFNAQGLFQKVPGDPVHFQAREGGVFSGPDSGYDNITLHGTEAVIPLKNGAVPVRLFGDETASSDTSDGMPDFDKLFSNITDDTKTQERMPDFGSIINSLGSTMFAAIQTLQPESISSKFDSELRQEVVEPAEATDDTATQVFDTPMANEPTGLMEFIKEAKEANFAMLTMMSELVREQRNANDISTRILQVSSN